jgi:hypothetical protein
MVYIPTQCPAIQNPDELRRWVEAEFMRIAQAMAATDLITDALRTFVSAGAYSEQAYTPVLTSIGGGTVPTFTAVPLAGYYARIGHLGVFGVYGTNTAGGVAGSGAFQLQCSLPSAADAAMRPIRVQLGVGNNGGVENIVLGEVVAAASQIQLYCMTGASQVATLKCQDFNNVSRALELFGFYRAA